MSSLLGASSSPISSSTTAPISQSRLSLAQICRNGLALPKKFRPDGSCLCSWNVKLLTLTAKGKKKRNGHHGVRSMAGEKSRLGRHWEPPLVPRPAVLERILRLIAGTTASPVGQFVSFPTTFLHSIDARVKLVWLLALVVLPARSHIVMRFGLVAYLVFLSICVLPKHVWMDQLGRLALICGILFIMLGFGSDGAPSLTQLRTPPPSLEGLPNIPMGDYSYLIMKFGPLQLTRKGFSVASTSACLAFTIFQSASLCLTTTTPEQLASAFKWFMTPLKIFSVPVAEIILTLLLSLRFISLVSDEVRNVAMGIVSRRINWQQLTVMETLDIFVIYIQRIFKNIFKHAEQISQAMIVRGFHGDCNMHKIYTFSSSSFSKADFIALLCLLGMIGGSVLSQNVLLT